MIIELRQPVLVRKADRVFETLPAGMKVNYSSRKESDKMIHKFSFVCRKTCKIYEHITVTPLTETPSWL